MPPFSKPPSSPPSTPSRSPLLEASPREKREGHSLLKAPFAALRSLPSRSPFEAPFKVPLRSPSRSPLEAPLHKPPSSPLRQPTFTLLVSCAPPRSPPSKGASRSPPSRSPLRWRGFRPGPFFLCTLAWHSIDTLAENPCTSSWRNIFCLTLSTEHSNWTLFRDTLSWSLAWHSCNTFARHSSLTLWQSTLWKNTLTGTLSWHSHSFGDCSSFPEVATKASCNQELHTWGKKLLLSLFLGTLLSRKWLLLLRAARDQTKSFTRVSCKSVLCKSFPNVGADSSSCFLIGLVV